MFDEICAKLPGSIVVVGAVVGFHDEGGNLARALRGRLFSRLVARLAEGSAPSEATLRDDAAEALAAEARASDIFLTACVLVQSPEEVQILAAGNYDIWQAADTGVSRVLAGASAWNAAVAAGARVDGMHRNMCVSALASERSRSVVQSARLRVAPTDTIIVTRGDIDPEVCLRSTRQGERGGVILALDAGPEIEVIGFGRCPRAAMISATLQGLGAPDFLA